MNKIELILLGLLKKPINPVLRYGISSIYHLDGDKYIAYRKELTPYEKYFLIKTHHKEEQNNLRGSELSSFYFLNIRLGLEHTLLTKLPEVNKSTNLDLWERWGLKNDGTILSPDKMDQEIKNFEENRKNSTLSLSDYDEIPF